MNTIKTGISIDKGLFREAEAAARRLKVSRSQLFARALRDFLERRENRRLFKQLNEAYAAAAEPTEHERKATVGMRRHQRRLVEGSW